VGGIQSLVLKWSNYECVTHGGYNYVRIKANFAVSNGEHFTIALVQSDDDGIGVFLAIPSTCASNSSETSHPAEDPWLTVAAATADMARADKLSYSELWVPGFHCESATTDLAPAFRAVVLGDKHVVMVNTGLDKC
jgi:hypothetical protein